MDLEFDGERRKLFKDADQLIQANIGKDMYIHLGNHYSVIEHYPLANILMVDYNPSLLFAKFANNPGDFTRWGVVDYVWTYCRLMQWLDGRGIKYTRIRNEPELGSLKYAPALQLVDLMNKDIDTTYEGSWEDERTVDAFGMLNYPRLSSAEVAQYFK